MADARKRWQGLKWRYAVLANLFVGIFALAHLAGKYFLPTTDRTSIYLEAQTGIASLLVSEFVTRGLERWIHALRRSRFAWIRHRPKTVTLVLAGLFASAGLVSATAGAWYMAEKFNDGGMLAMDLSAKRLAFERAVAFDSTLAVARYNLGATCEALHDPAAAAAHYAAAITIDPAFAAPLNNLARIRISEGKPREAIQLLTDALHREPGMRHAERGVVLRNIAWAYYEMKDDVHAREFVDRAKVELSRKEPGTRESPDAVVFCLDALLLKRESAADGADGAAVGSRERAAWMTCRALTPKDSDIVPAAWQDQARARLAMADAR